MGLHRCGKPKDRPATPAGNVETITIDRILEGFGSQRIMMCKMDIEGAEFELPMQVGWLDKADVLMIELHERIVTGCEQAFEDANKDRFVFPTGSEKLVSVAKGYFASLDAESRVQGVGVPASHPFAANSRAEAPGQPRRA